LQTGGTRKSVSTKIKRAETCPFIFCNKYIAINRNFRKEKKIWAIVLNKFVSF